MDLDVLRSSLKCCQHCKAGEKKHFPAQRKSTQKKSQNKLSVLWQVHTALWL